MPSIPTLDKTWQHDLNVALATTSTKDGDHRQLIRRIKTALISFGTLPWTVQGSSDGGVAGMDAVDRWGTPTAATGSITTIVKANLIDGEKVVISDGTTSYNFWIDQTGTYIPVGGYDATNIRVNVSADTTADNVRDTFVISINGAIIEVTASIGGAATVALVNDFTTKGRNPNVAITETVVDAGFGVAGMTGGINDLIFATGAHSWIVLRQIGIATNFELVIDCNAADSRNVSIIISWSTAFVGGSIGAAPTAANSLTLTTIATWGTPDAAFDAKLHVQQSTDGAVTRGFIVVDDGGPAWHVKRWFEFAVPKSPLSAWTNPTYVIWKTLDGATSPLELEMNEDAPATGRLTTNFTLAFSAQRNKDDPDGSMWNKKNDVESAWELRPIGLTSITSGKTGRHGEVFDLWFSHARTTDGGATPESGHYFPSTARDFMQLGEITIPWLAASGALAGGDVDTAQNALYAPGISMYGQESVSVGSDTADVAGSLLDGMANLTTNAAGGRNVGWLAKESAAVNDGFLSVQRRDFQTGFDIARTRQQAAVTRRVWSEAQANTSDAVMASSGIVVRAVRITGNFHTFPQGSNLTVIILRVGS